MSVKVKEYKEFQEKLKNIDPGFEVDIQFWIFHGKPAAVKRYRKDNEFIELSIYYNYKKDLVSKITKNRIISENEGCMMSTPYETIKEEFEEVKQASKKNILKKVEEFKNIDLKQFEGV